MVALIFLIVLIWPGAALDPAAALWLVVARERCVKISKMQTEKEK